MKQDEILKAEIWSSINVRFDLTFEERKIQDVQQNTVFFSKEQLRIFCEIEEISHAAKRVSE